MTTAMAAHGLVTKAAFGNTPDGTAVDIYTLKADGIEAQRNDVWRTRCLDQDAGSRWQGANVVLGYSALDGYLEDKTTYFGAIVGRYGNRIALGKFSIDGHQYQVPVNNNANSLHGGHGWLRQTGVDGARDY